MSDDESSNTGDEKNILVLPLHLTYFALPYVKPLKKNPPSPHIITRPNTETSDSGEDEDDLQPEVTEYLLATNTSQYSGKIRMHATNYYFGEKGFADELEAIDGKSPELILEGLHSKSKVPRETQNYMLALFHALSPHLASAMSVDPSLKTDSSQASLNLWRELTGMSAYGEEKRSNDTDLFFYFTENYIFSYMDFDTKLDFYKKSFFKNKYKTLCGAGLVHVFLVKFKNKLFLLKQTSKNNSASDFSSQTFECNFLDKNLMATSEDKQNLESKIKSIIELIFDTVNVDMNLDFYDENETPIRDRTKMTKQVFLIVKQVLGIGTKNGIQKTDEDKDNYLMRAIYIFLDRNYFFVPCCGLRKSPYDQNSRFYYCLFLRFSDPEPGKPYENDWAIVNDQDNFPTIFDQIDEQEYNRFLKKRFVCGFAIDKNYQNSVHKWYRILTIRNLCNQNFGAELIHFGQFNHTFFREVQLSQFYIFFLQKQKTNFLLFALFDIYFKKMDWTGMLYDPEEIQVDGGSFKKTRILYESQKSIEELFCTAGNIENGKFVTSQKMLRRNGDQSGLFFDEEKPIRFGQEQTLKTFFSDIYEINQRNTFCCFFAEDASFGNLDEHMSFVEKFQPDYDNKKGLCYIYNLFSFIVEELSRQTPPGDRRVRYIAKKREQTANELALLMQPDFSIKEYRTFEWIFETWSNMDTRNRRDLGLSDEA